MRRLLACSLVFWLGCGPSTSQRYATIDRDAEVVAGMEVRMKDQTVGVVGDVALAADNLYILRLDLEPESAKLIPVDSRVQVKRAAVVVGDRYLRILPGEGPMATAADTLRAQPSWWADQQAKLRQVSEGITDPELRTRLDAFRKEVGAATEAGKDRWDEARPGLEKRAQDIYDYAARTVPQIAGAIRDQLQRLLDEAGKLND